MMPLTNVSEFLGRTELLIFPNVPEKYNLTRHDQPAEESRMLTLALHSKVLPQKNMQNLRGVEPKNLPAFLLRTFEWCHLP